MQAINAPETHFAMLGGVAVGKSFTGSHFAIKMICEHPELTGFVGANTWDQLNQATLRELVFWLNEYGFQFMLGQRPPPEWGGVRRFKDYGNILSVKVGKQIATVFLRVLSDGNPLRGIQFSWYWIDETRDTPLNTHDILLSRLRESKKVVKGLVTTTPNAEDWVWTRFVKDGRPPLFGHSHTPTSEAVKFGIITEDFYNALRSAYSPAMAAQELDALHVNALQGRAYYCATSRNRIRGPQPDPYFPLVVGCDFNFSPAPMVWVIGQVSEDGKSLHWFDEFSAVECSSPQMARRLAEKYGNFYLRIFGDASGTRGTTSNAGQTDFDQIGNELALAGVVYSIDVDQMNPLVRDRIENVNRLLEDADGHVSMTVDPDRCPLLAGDFEKVVWKNGKLSGEGDPLRTHGGDAAGYVCWKVFPPQVHNLRVIKSIASPYAALRS